MSLTVLYQDIVFNVQGTAFWPMLVAPATYKYEVLLDNKQSIVLTIDQDSLVFPSLA